MGGSSDAAFRRKRVLEETSRVSGPERGSAQRLRQRRKRSPAARPPAKAAQALRVSTNDGRGEPVTGRRRGDLVAQEPSSAGLCAAETAHPDHRPPGRASQACASLRPTGLRGGRHAAEAAGSPPPLTRRCAVRSHKPNGRRARALSDGDRRALSQPVPPDMTLTGDDHGFQVEGTPGSPFHVRASPPLAGYK